MTLLHPGQILKDQFRTPRTPPRSFAGWRGAQFAWLAIGALAGIFVWWRHIETVAMAPLLTATSIITGLTFTMAMRFWERSIDARKDPVFLVDPARVDLLDQMGTHLIWTVISGVVSTAWLAGAALVSGTHLSVLGSAVAAGLFAYQLVLVAHSLILLYNSAAELVE